MNSLLADPVIGSRSDRSRSEARFADPRSERVVFGSVRGGDLSHLVVERKTRSNLSLRATVYLADGLGPIISSTYLAGWLASTSERKHS